MTATATRDQETDMTGPLARIGRDSSPWLNALLLIAAGTARAQDFTLDQSGIAPGGEQFAGGDWTLEAMRGQPTAGVAEGDNLALFVGFWAPDNVAKVSTIVTYSKPTQQEH